MRIVEENEQRRGERREDGKEREVVNRGGRGKSMRNM